MASNAVVQHWHQPTRIRFDRTALRFNQAAIISLLVLAFIIDLRWLVVFVGAVMAIGTLFPQAALFQLFYRTVLRPAGLLRPDLHTEDAAPHRFAQGVGATTLLAAILALFGGAVLLGWGLVFVVVVLAAINVLFGFCMGCFIYFQLQQLHVRGR